MSETLTDTSVRCRNCDTTFEGKYCPNCSQKASTHRLTLKHFFHEAFHAITHTDKGILFLAKKLVRWPGVVAREYVEGKRKKYFSPFTFLLITLAIQLYVSKKTEFYTHFLDSTEALMQRAAASISPSEQVPDRSMATLKDMRTQTTKAMENGKVITFFLLPVLALLSWLFFYNSRMNYTENIVMALFVQGQVNLLFLVFCILPFLIFPALVVPLLYFYVLISWAYSLIAYRQFFRQRKWVTILKGSVVQILYFLMAERVTKLVVEFM
jgi:hypothetical protein